MGKRYWLLKTEPDTYSINDLASKPKQTDRWDGIRNYQARNFMRDKVQRGDGCFIYHSQCKTVGIVGTAKVVKAAYPDPAQFDPEDHYFDPKATAEAPRWFAIDVQLTNIFPQTITLKQIKQIPALANMVLVKQGRLSVQPIAIEEWRVIEQLTQAQQ